MSGPASQPQWYLARDGNQHGPISDAELTRFMEQGHLLPTDLLWRDGFADWQPAMSVFPSRSPGGARTIPPQRRAEARAHPGGQANGGIGGRLRRIAAVLLVVVAVVGAGMLGYVYRAQLAELGTSLTATSGAMAIGDRKSLEAPPLAGFRGGNVGSIDASLQATALWPVIKREFPEWYQQRVSEAAALAGENKDDAAIGQHLANKLRELRRQQVTSGLQATQDRLKAVALAFYDNLSKLRRHGTEACHGFIMGGEANPAIVPLLQGTEFTPGLQAQLTVMFEAIAEGRRQPRVHVRPSREEFQQVANSLVKMGWTQADMVLFNDDKALAKAPSEKVCQLVHDFFKAQVDVPDPEVQTKLLINALRPVFAG
jgi:GYF domain 2